MDYHTWDDDEYKRRITGDQKDTVVQISISLIAGLTAFIAFCVSFSAKLASTVVDSSLPRFCDPDGLLFMPLGNAKRMRPSLYQTCRHRSSDGFLRYGA
jgi:hypothetical protein